jgi:hypothetical protein
MDSDGQFVTECLGLLGIFHHVQLFVFVLEDGMADISYDGFDVC